jgi:geranylgeranyl pyrophosphate synthase
LIPVSQNADILLQYRQRVEQALMERLPPETRTPQRLHAAMRYATLNGGKRIRACLTYGTGVAADAKPAQLDAPACAVEMIHSFSLVHDDLPCMDNDDLRRGRPTCHRAFDEGTALLAGDALQSLAFELLGSDSTMTISAETRLDMTSLLARATGSIGMAGGQAIDIESVGRSLTVDELKSMHERKTGQLIHTAVVLGAMAAAADDIFLRAVSGYGRAIGLAFQVVDDILDVTADTATLGKPQGSDVARNKPTYPALLGLDAARELAGRLRDEALESLAPLGDNGGFLAFLADYIIERSQ